MRFIIAAAALLLCVFEGRKKSLALKNRAEFLAETIQMLCDISAKIKLFAPPLDELFENENGRFAKKVKEYREKDTDIRAAWEKACESLGKTEEADCLFALGKALSQSDSESAVNAVSLCLEKLSRLEKTAREAYAKKGGAFVKIGALCGIAAAIMII